MACEGISPVRILKLAALPLVALLVLNSLAVWAQVNSARTTGKSATSLSSLPLDAQGPISAVLGKDDSGYWVHPIAKGFRGKICSTRWWRSSRGQGPRCAATTCVGAS